MYRPMLYFLNRNITRFVRKRR